MVAWLHGCHVLHVLGFIEVPWIWALFLPVPLAEWWLSGRFSPPETGKKSRRRKRVVVPTAVVLRSAGWVVAFYGWVIWPGELIQSPSWYWIKWVGPRIDVNVRLVLGGNWPFTLLALAVGVLVYFWLVVRRRQARVFASVVFPLLLGVGVFAELYAFGGVGGLNSVAAVLAQPGVSRESRLDEAAGHPRDVCVDEARNMLFASFGCTLCRVEDRVPSVYRLDLGSGEVKSFVSGPVREFDCPAGSDFVAIAPWHDERAFLLSRDGFPAATILDPRARAHTALWEPMSTVLDEVHGRLFVANDVQQAVYVLDSSTGEWLAGLDLAKLGYITRYGVAAQSMVQPTPGGMIYFASGPGENVYELDPASMKITRTLALGDAAGTALTVDPEGQRLWYQASLLDEIFEVDLNTFTVTRTLPGERFSRGLAYDSARNLLYSLAYFSGTLSAINLDSGAVVGGVAVGGRPNALTKVGDTVWVNSMAGILKIDLGPTFGRLEPKK